MKRTLSIAALLLLTGCSTVGQLDNIASCTPDGKTMLVSSMYGPIGITSKIRQADAEAFCKKS